MKARMIATWKMSFAGVKKGASLLKEGYDAGCAIEEAIRMVENEEAFCSVGYGGLPNKEGIVELDAAYMDGKTLGYGAVMALQDIQNPISVAKSLALKNVNCVLAGKGANDYAHECGFTRKAMLSEKAHQRWEKEAKNKKTLKAYDGHDTVCMIAKDKKGDMVSGVSTSGLFMKDYGRVGDSPIIGSGFYCDNEVGGATATGLGEDIMRGCLSMQILTMIKLGVDVQSACDRVLDEHMSRMQRASKCCDAISLIAMDQEGHYGASTNIDAFPYVIINEQEEVEIHVASYQDGKHHNFKADDAWLRQYTGD